jgi:hypothetical protein
MMRHLYTITNKEVVERGDRLKRSSVLIGVETV